MENFGSGVSAFVQTSQSNLLREEEIKYDLESKRYAQMLSDNQRNPGTWNENLLNAKEKELDAAKRMLEVGKQAVAYSSLVQGANALRDSGALTEGGEEFVEALAQPMLQRAIYDPDAEIDLGDAFLVHAHF